MATIHDLFTEEQLKDAHVLNADMMQTVYLHNKGNGGFENIPLPMEAQLSPVYAIAAPTSTKMESRISFWQVIMPGHV